MHARGLLVGVQCPTDLIIHGHPARPALFHLSPDNSGELFKGNRHEPVH
jgi:hypothetical protein